MKSSASRLLLAPTVVVIAIILAVLIPWWNHTRTVAMENACVDNLRHIDAAKQQWALDYGPTLSSNAILTWGDLAPFLASSQVFQGYGARGFSLPKYPPEATYIIGNLAVSPRCSYAGHIFALFGIMIHIGDASFASKNSKAFEYYDLPGGMPGMPRRELRVAGTIVGATVKVLDETGHWTRVETGEDGTATLDTFSNKPVAIVVSKEGFLTSSNVVHDLYRYDYNILLKKEMK